MDWFWQYLDNLRSASLAEPIEFLAAVIPILGVLGAIYLYFSGRLGKLFGKTEPNTNEAKIEGMAEAPATFIPEQPVLTLTLDQYESRLKTRETELRTELEAAHADEKALLQTQIAELQNQQNHPEEAFQAFKIRIAQLEASLGNAETEDEQAAKAALEEGDLIEADDIFARIQAAQALNIQKASNAAYARGEIAEQQIRWKDALAHYTRAAELDANFKTLRQHWDLLWKMGLYQEAIPIGERLEAAAITEFGNESDEHAVALSCRAVILNHLGRFDEAEPLYRESMRIREVALGKEHPAYATSLNNLAGLLEDTGRYADAEPLYREAMRIREVALGKEHPDYAGSLNNLAGLLRTTGRVEEAEPLYREAMRITEVALGKEHPDYAIDLNNLAGLLRATGRQKEAEPLFRDAMRIREIALGKEHPDYAQSLNNLAGLLETTGRQKEAEPLYVQAIAIWEASLGPDHPNTKGGKQNLEILRAEMGKA